MTSILDFYSWTLTLSGKISRPFFHILRNFAQKQKVVYSFLIYFHQRIRWSYKRNAFRWRAHGDHSSDSNLLSYCVDWAENYAQVSISFENFKFPWFLVKKREYHKIIRSFQLNESFKCFFKFFNSMKYFSRKPFELKQTLLTYNLAVALLNLYIASELLIASISLKYNYICQPYKQIFSKDELRVSSESPPSPPLLPKRATIFVNLCVFSLIRLQTQFGGSISPSASNFVIVSSSFCVKKTLNWRSCTCIITAQCSRFGGLASNTFQVVQVSDNTSFKLN